MRVTDSTQKNLTRGDQQALVVLAITDIAARGQFALNYDVAIIDLAGAGYRVRLRNGNGHEGHSVMVSEEALEAWRPKNAAGMERQRQGLENIIGYLDDLRAGCIDAADRIEDEPWPQFTEAAQDVVAEVLDKVRAAASLCDEAEEILNELEGNG